MCIGLHTLPPCLLFCGNYILHESEYDVHIFCVALDIIIYPAPVFSPFPGERGQFGKDAEIRTHKALHDAKPSKCPKGDRDIKSALHYKISFCFNLNAVKQRMDILPHIAAFFKYRRQVYH